MRLLGHGVLCLALANIDKWFPQVVAPIYTHLKRMRILAAPHPWQHLVLSVTLILTIQEVQFMVVLICTSPMSNEVEYISKAYRLFGYLLL